MTSHSEGGGPSHNGDSPSNSARTGSPPPVAESQPALAGRPKSLILNAPVVAGSAPSASAATSANNNVPRGPDSPQPDKTAAASRPSTTVVAPPPPPLSIQTSTASTVAPVSAPAPLFLTSIPSRISLDDVVLGGNRVLKVYTVTNASSVSRLKLRLQSSLGGQLAFQLSNENIRDDGTVKGSNEFNDLYNTIDLVYEVVLLPSETRQIIMSFLPDKEAGDIATSTASTNDAAVTSGNQPASSAVAADTLAVADPVEALTKVSDKSSSAKSTEYANAFDITGNIYISATLLPDEIANATPLQSSSPLITPSLEVPAISHGTLANTAEEMASANPAADASTVDIEIRKALDNSAKTVTSVPADSQRQTFRFKARVCRSVLFVDVSELVFDRSVIGTSYFAEFTIWNRSEISLQYAMNFKLLDASIYQLDFTDFETGQSLQQHSLLGFAHCRVRVAFRGLKVGELRSTVYVENLRDPTNLATITVFASVIRSASVSPLFVSDAGVIDIGNCYTGQQASRTITLRNVSENQLDVLVIPSLANEMMICTSNSLGAEASALEELSLEPSKDIQLILHYTPDIIPYESNARRTKLQRRYFELKLVVHSSAGQMVENRVVRFKANVCTSLINLPKKSVNLGDVSVGTSKQVSVTIENLSALPARIRPDFSSEVVSCDTSQVFLEPFSKFDIKLNVLPRAVEVDYRKVITLINYFNRANDCTVELRGNFVNPKGVSMHSLYYSIHTSGGVKDKIAFGHGMLHCPTMRSLTVKNITANPLTLAFTTSVPDELALYTKAVSQSLSNALVSQQHSFDGGFEPAAFANKFLSIDASSSTRIQSAPEGVKGVQVTQATGTSSPQGAASQTPAVGPSPVNQSFMPPSQQHAVVTGASTNTSVSQLPRNGSFTETSKLLAVIHSDKKSSEAIRHTQYLDLAVNPLNLNGKVVTTAANADSPTHGNTLLHSTTPNSLRLQDPSSSTNNNNSNLFADEPAPILAKPRAKSKTELTLGLTGSTPHHTVDVPLHDVAAPTESVVGLTVSQFIEEIVRGHEELNLERLDFNFASAAQECNYVAAAGKLVENTQKCIESCLVRASETAMTIAAKSEVTFIVVFVPSKSLPRERLGKVHNREENLIIKLVAGDNGRAGMNVEDIPPLELPVTAKICGTVVQLSQPHINFGKVHKHEIRERVLLVSNQSALPLLYHIRKSRSIASDYLIFNSNTFGIVPPYSQKQIDFQFQPKMHGIFHEKLEVGSVFDPQHMTSLEVKAVVGKPLRFKISTTEDLICGPMTVGKSRSVHKIEVTNISNHRRMYVCSVNYSKATWRFCVPIIHMEVDQQTTATKPKMVTKEDEEQIEELERKIKKWHTKKYLDRIRVAEETIRRLRAGLPVTYSAIVDDTTSEASEDEGEAGSSRRRSSTPSNSGAGGDSTGNTGLSQRDSGTRLTFPILAGRSATVTISVMFDILPNVKLEMHVEDGSVPIRIQEQHNADYIASTDLRATVLYQDSQLKHTQEHLDWSGRSNRRGPYSTVPRAPPTDRLSRSGSLENDILPAPPEFRRRPFMRARTSSTELPVALKVDPPEVYLSQVVLGVTVESQFIIRNPADTPAAFVIIEERSAAEDEASASSPKYSVTTPTAIVASPAADWKASMISPQKPKMRSEFTFDSINGHIPPHGFHIVKFTYKPSKAGRRNYRVVILHTGNRLETQVGIVAQCSAPSYISIAGLSQQTVFVPYAGNGKTDSQAASRRVSAVTGSSSSMVSVTSAKPKAKESGSSKVVDFGLFHLTDTEPNGPPVVLVVQNIHFSSIRISCTTNMAKTLYVYTNEAGTNPALNVLIKPKASLTLWVVLKPRLFASPEKAQPISGGLTILVYPGQVENLSDVDPLEQKTLSVHAIVGRAPLKLSTKLVDMGSTTQLNTVFRHTMQLRNESTHLPLSFHIEAPKELQLNRVRGVLASKSVVELPSKTPDRRLTKELPNVLDLEIWCSATRRGLTQHQLKIVNDSDRTTQQVTVLYFVDENIIHSDLPVSNLMTNVSTPSTANSSPSPTPSPLMLTPASTLRSLVLPVMYVALNKSDAVPFEILGPAPVAAPALTENWSKLIEFGGRYWGQLSLTNRSDKALKMVPLSEINTVVEWQSAGGLVRSSKDFSDVKDVRTVDGDDDSRDVERDLHVCGDAYVLLPRASVVVRVCIPIPERLGIKKMASLQEGQTVIYSGVLCFARYTGMKPLPSDIVKMIHVESCYCVSLGALDPPSLDLGKIGYKTGWEKSIVKFSVKNRSHVVLQYKFNALPPGLLDLSEVTNNDILSPVDLNAIELLVPTDQRGYQALLDPSLLDINTAGLKQLAISVLNMCNPHNEMILQIQATMTLIGIKFEPLYESHMYFPPLLLPSVSATPDPCDEWVRCINVSDEELRFRVYVEVSEVLVDLVHYDVVMRKNNMPFEELVLDRSENTEIRVRFHACEDVRITPALRAMIAEAHAQSPSGEGRIMFGHLCFKKLLPDGTEVTSVKEKIELWGIVIDQATLEVSPSRVRITCNSNLAGEIVPPTQQASKAPSPQKPPVHLASGSISRSISADTELEQLSGADPVFNLSPVKDSGDENEDEGFVPSHQILRSNTATVIVPTDESILSVSSVNALEPSVAVVTVRNLSTVFPLRFKTRLEIDDRMMPAEGAPLVLAADICSITPDASEIAPGASMLLQLSVPAYIIVDGLLPMRLFVEDAHVNGHCVVEVDIQLVTSEEDEELSHRDQQQRRRGQETDTDDMHDHLRDSSLDHEKPDTSGFDLDRAPLPLSSIAEVASTSALPPSEPLSAGENASGTVSRPFSPRNQLDLTSPLISGRSSPQLFPSPMIDLPLPSPAASPALAPGPQSQAPLQSATTAPVNSVFEPVNSAAISRRESEVKEVAVTNELVAVTSAVDTAPPAVLSAPDMAPSANQKLFQTFVSTCPLRVRNCTPNRSDGWYTYLLDLGRVHEKHTTADIHVQNISRRRVTFNMQVMSQVTDWLVIKNPNNIKLNAGDMIRLPFSILVSRPGSYCAHILLREHNVQSSTAGSTPALGATSSAPPGSGTNALPPLAAGGCLLIRVIVEITGIPLDRMRLWAGGRFAFPASGNSMIEHNSGVPNAELPPASAVASLPRRLYLGLCVYGRFDEGFSFSLQNCGSVCSDFILSYSGNVGKDELVFTTERFSARVCKGVFLPAHSIVPVHVRFCPLQSLLPAAAAVAAKVSAVGEEVAPQHSSRPGSPVFEKKAPPPLPPPAIVGLTPRPSISNAIERRCLQINVNGRLAKDHQETLLAYCVCRAPMIRVSTTSLMFVVTPELSNMADLEASVSTVPASAGAAPASVNQPVPATPRDSVVSVGAVNQTGAAANVDDEDEVVGVEAKRKTVMWSTIKAPQTAGIQLKTTAKADEDLHVEVTGEVGQRFAVLNDTATFSCRVEENGSLRIRVRAQALARILRGNDSVLQEHITVYSMQDPAESVTVYVRLFMSKKESWEGTVETGFSSRFFHGSLTRAAHVFSTMEARALSVLAVVGSGSPVDWSGDELRLLFAHCCHELHYFIMHGLNSYFIASMSCTLFCTVFGHATFASIGSATLKALCDADFEKPIAPNVAGHRDHPQQQHHHHHSDEESESTDLLNSRASLSISPTSQVWPDDLAFWIERALCVVHAVADPDQLMAPARLCVESLIANLN